MALSVDLIFLLKAPLKKCLFINRLDHTVKYDSKKKKKEGERQKKKWGHIFPFIFKCKDASFLICWIFNDLLSRGDPRGLGSLLTPPPPGLDPPCPPLSPLYPSWVPPRSPPVPPPPPSVPATFGRASRDVPDSVPGLRAR